MFGMWDVQDVGCLGCVMWDVGCLPGCGMLIYKMPNFMTRKLNTRLLFTDRESLCYQLHEKNPYKKMYKYKKLFDLSNFPVSSKYCCSDNKKVVGKIKDEYGGKSILKFVGLKSNMYSILDESSNEKSTNKGHSAFIEFQEFHDTLF